MPTMQDRQESLKGKLVSSEASIYMIINSFNNQYEQNYSHLEKLNREF